MWTTVTTPVGELRLVAGDDGLTGIDFLGEAPSGPGESASAVYAARAQERPAGERDDGHAVLKETGAQLAAYFEGRLRTFDLPLAASGTPFQQRVWEQLRTIGYGETATYGEIAGRLGLTGHGARAVGVANGRNPLPIVVPCHRVVGAGGRLTGYGGGMARKQHLLRLESAALF